MSEHTHGGARVLYGPALHEAARSGDVSHMRELEQQAEQHLKEVSSALEELRSAIKRHHG